MRAAAMRAAVVVLLVVGVVMPASGQSLLDPLPATEPTTFAYRLGPLQANPGFQINELGVDNNVFDDPDNPQRDWVVRITPTLGLYSRLGFTQFFGSVDTDLTYFHKFTSERSVSRSVRGRFNFDLSRLRPVIGGAYVESGDRPNAEIDLRAQRQATELNAQVGYEVSPLMLVYAGGRANRITYDEGEVFRDVDLSSALSYDTETVNAGFSFAATPFTTVSAYASVSRDLFREAPLRNTESRSAHVELTFGSDAIIRGRTRVGFQSLTAVDPDLSDYRGVVSSVQLSTTGFWRGRIDGGFTRQVEYSFDETNGYFVASGINLSYNQRVAGAWDFEVRGGRDAMDYSAIAAQERTDVRLTYSAGIGYNLQTQSRIGIAWEYSERTSPERPDRRYTRQRIVGSWTMRMQP